MSEHTIAASEVRSLPLHGFGGGLYRCYDAGRRCLYVGATGDYRERFLKHRLRSKWWPDVTHIELDHHNGDWRGYYPPPALLAAEGQQIAELRPTHNRHHNPDWVLRRDGMRRYWVRADEQAAS